MASNNFKAWFSSSSSSNTQKTNENEMKEFKSGEQQYRENIQRSENYQYEKQNQHNEELERIYKSLGR